MSGDEQAGASLNPFRAGEPETISADPCALVIFGASGDLARRKLLPAIYALKHNGYLGARHPIIGFARSANTDAGFREQTRESLAQFSRFTDASEFETTAFLENLYYQIGDYSDISAYHALAERLNELSDSRGGGGSCLFYLATPPGSFGAILDNLKSSGLVAENDDLFRRVIVEKPIGSDRESARKLNKRIHKSFSESQVFRIDHYLGKETVQNILAFRFGNGIFEPLWNRRYIDHVQVTVAESIGVGSRAGYFDRAGITRDMFQSHILQLLTLIAMEPPVAAQGEAIRNEKVKVLSSIRPYSEDEVCERVVRAQYDAGSVDGADVPGYLSEDDVPEQSETETFLALKLEIDNWRWSGVPFYVRTGKRLAKRVSQVNIVYRRPPLAFFEQAGGETPEQNALGIRIQPDESIALNVVAKRPGPTFHVDPVRMDFNYRTAFSSQSPEAYERLILDAILGESSLFAREDEVDLSWKLVDPILQTWEETGRCKLHQYQAGAWGPAASSELLGRDNRSWLRL